MEAWHVTVLGECRELKNTIGGEGGNGKWAKGYFLGDKCSECLVFEPILDLQ